MPRLGDFLLKSRAVTDSQLTTALAEQQRWGGLIGEILLRMDYVSEAVLVDALTRQLGVPLAEPGLLASPEPAAQRRVPFEVARKLRALPLQLRDQGKVLTAAICEPQNLSLLDELRKATSCRISARLIGPQTFLSRLNQHYGAEAFGDDSSVGEDSFKMVDSQGRTLIRGMADLEREANAKRAAPPVAVPVAEPAVVPRSAGAVAELLSRIEATQRSEVAALRAMVELLIERGVFTREDYLARVRK